MKYTDSVAIIRTRKGNTIGCHMISTYNYCKLMPNQFVYNGYFCEAFEIYENVGGQVKIKTFDKLHHSGIELENVITMSNVTGIEIMSEYDS